MSPALSLLYILVAYVLLFALGAGPVLSCLPPALRRLAPYAAPAVGCAVFCFLSIFLSGVLGIPVCTANWAALATLLAWSAFALARARASLRDHASAARHLVLLFVVMAALLFFAVLDQGVDQYLGTVNPDFLQSLAFQDLIVRRDLPFWSRPADLAQSGLYFQLMFPEQFQARFGAVAFSTLVQQLSGLDGRGALVISLVAFVLCLPGAVFVFSRGVLALDEAASFAAALFVAVSGATAMSFVHALVGQNSALAMFPLTLALLYHASRERSWALALLCAFVLNGVFWMYVMVLPYVLVPFAGYIALKMFTQGWRSIRPVVWSAAVVGAFTVVFHAFAAAETLRFVKNLLELLSGISRARVYLDFLREDVLVYATGLSSYPLVHHGLFHAVAEYLLPVLVALGFALAALYFAAARRWERTAPRDAVLLVVASLSTYLAVWFFYTFISRYGYASFKMAAWLQFIQVPFLGLAAVESFRRLRSDGREPGALAAIGVLLLVGPTYLVLNVISVLDYNAKSYGRDRLHGSLINSYGIAGNRDFNRLPHDLASHIAGTKSVALGFPDYIENLVASYYANDATGPLSLLAHDRLPDDDSFLPDVVTRRSIDTSGVARLYENPYFHDGVADYYLLSSRQSLNNDIVLAPAGGTPAWSNSTFLLYGRADLSDLVFTGRGFFRVEYQDVPSGPWWWPRVFRWTAEGGELYHLLPKSPDAPYRLAFSAIAGPGYPTGVRTIEVWHNGRKIDELVLRGAGRLASKPYYPVVGVNRLVLKIKERSIPTELRFGLWNRDLPGRARPINVAISDVDMSRELLPRAPFENGVAKPAAKLFDAFETFNGFDIDGWVREEAWFTARAPASVHRVVLTLLVPGNLGFAFPYTVRFSVNGSETQRRFDVPGEYRVELEIPRGNDAGALDMVIRPQAAKRLADGMTQREVVQSVRVGSLGFAE